MFLLHGKQLPMKSDTGWSQEIMTWIQHTSIVPKSFPHTATVQKHLFSFFFSYLLQTKSADGDHKSTKFSACEVSYWGLWISLNNCVNTWFNKKMSSMRYMLLFKWRVFLCFVERFGIKNVEKSVATWLQNSDGQGTILMKVNACVTLKQNLLLRPWQVKWFWGFSHQTAEASRMWLLCWK